MTTREPLTLLLLLAAFNSPARAEDATPPTAPLVAQMRAVGAGGACRPVPTRAGFQRLDASCRHRLACETMRERLKTARELLRRPACDALFRRARVIGIKNHGQSPLYYFDALDDAGVCADNPNLTPEQNLNQSFESAVSKVFISDSCGGGLANGQGRGSEGKMCITAENFLYGVADGFDERTGVYWSQLQLILHEFGHNLDAIYDENGEGSSVDNQRLIGWHCIEQSGDPAAAAAYQGSAVPLRP
ncbi:MAG: hypothetical protein SF051_09495 [Elusimicrobiota bacterium]|nr:hypothetical protein [Elusimicrobiota bacterium]